MKAMLQILTILFVFFGFDTHAGIAQLPQEVIDTAKAQFEAAYEAESGEPPSAATTAQAMQSYTRTVNRLSTSLGTREGQQAKSLAKIKSGLLDSPAMIEALEEVVRSNRLSDLGISKAKVVELADPDMPIHQVDGAELIKNPELIFELKENSEIMFPAGAFTFDEQKLVRTLRAAGKEFPNGVALVGAGKDKTTLKITDAGFTRGDVDHLSFRDMTIDCDNDGLFDKRQGSLTLRLSNVRLVRFDAGHGGCRLFSINEGLIVHATDCEFVGGHGSSPGHGSIFDSCDVFLGYFEHCEFSGIKYELFRSIRDHKSILWMDECKFDTKYRSNSAVNLKGCEFDFEPPKLKLGDGGCFWQVKFN